ncbi:hypothetical protein B296_00029888 [Ensete ventricosum]|uniref:C2H2-type domain-containing protein n=1 Tax=Ensete ventricosum TaxID=4639 RepID=A0A426XUT2_ENSVE|nr:hypothetical protein B296_00029888 [Ensete ventricosum]
MRATTLPVVAKRIRWQMEGEPYPRKVDHLQSAQALGGHMNVHRRDKARLRESPPSGPSLLNTNPNPNPNLSSTPIPNLNMPPPSSAAGNSRHAPVTCEFPSELSPLIHLSPSSASAPTGEGLKIMETGKSLSGIEEFKGLDQEGSKVVSLDLEIGVFGDYGYVDDLDLELRLGYT